MEDECIEERGEERREGLRQVSKRAEERRGAERMEDECIEERGEEKREGKG